MTSRSCFIALLPVVCALLGSPVAAEPTPRTQRHAKQMEQVRALSDARHRTDRDYSHRLKAANRILRQLHQELPENERPPFARLASRLGYPVPAWGNGLECVNSPEVPITVCHSRTEDKAFADQVMQRAEIAWTEQVTKLGFDPPSTSANFEPIHEGLDIYIDETVVKQSPYTAYGYVSLYGPNPNTPRDDCLSYMMIGAFNSQAQVDEQELQLLIHHEFHHAVQAAMSCSSNPFTYEAGAQWMQAHFGPLDPLTIEAADVYQAHPNYPLAYYALEGPLAAYQYGGFLFFQFIEEHLGQGDPVVIRQLWEKMVHADQTDAPTLLDALGQTVQPAGLGLADVVEQFGEWRYFVGPKSDGKHFRHAEAYAPLATVTWEISTLAPGTTLKKQLKEIYELGYGHVELTGLAGLGNASLRIEVTSPCSGVDWDFIVYSVKNKAIASATPAGDRAMDTRSARVPLESVTTTEPLLVVLSNLGSPTLDMDHYETFRSCTFTLALGLEPPPPADALTRDGGVTVTDGDPAPDGDNGCQCAFGTTGRIAGIPGGPLALTLALLCWTNRRSRTRDVPPTTSRGPSR